MRYYLKFYTLLWLSVKIHSEEGTAFVGDLEPLRNLGIQFSILAFMPAVAIWLFY